MAKKQRKALLVARDSDFQKYAANKLFDEGIISSVIFEDGKSIWKEEESKYKQFNLKKKFRNLMWGNQKFHSQRILQSQYKSLNENIDFFQFKNINSNDAFLKIKELNPSLVIVLGTRIIKEELFENIDCEFINIHWGMSPFYRGDGIITPIYQNNWEKLGFTIHILDSGIDSGEIICSERIDIDEQDNFYSIGLKMTKKAIEYISNGIIIESKLNTSNILLKQNLSKGILANSSYLKKNKHIKVLSPVNLFKKKSSIVCRRLLKSLFKSIIGIFTYPILPKGDQVFLYHEVTNDPSEFALENDIYIKNDIFEDQIRWISKRYRIIDPIELLNGKIETPNKFKKKKALITFDDGSASIFENAAPILRKHGLKAIVFLNMAPIKKEDWFSGLICYLKSKDYLFKQKMNKIYSDRKDNFLFFSMNDINKYSHATKNNSFSKKLLNYHGRFATKEQLDKNKDVFVYGSHLYNHFNAINLTESELSIQIEKNSNELKKINGEPELFSYPFGQPNSCYSSKTDEIISNLGVKKIFYAYPKNNYSLDGVSLYRTNTGNYFNLGYMRFSCGFKPFFNQLRKSF
tara:strand:+ start:633 stop:2360 length:1728 start_codon:yes stop_codon:yes gene_type:complete